MGGAEMTEGVVGRREDEDDRVLAQCHAETLCWRLVSRAPAGLRDRVSLCSFAWPAAMQAD